MKRSIYIFLAGVLMITACQHQPDPEPAAPEIDITNPPSDVIFNNGDTIHMEGTLSDEDALHEASILISDTADTFFIYQPYVHDLQSFDVDTFWVVTGITGDTPSYVTFQAENHHEKSTTINLSVLLKL